MVTGFIEKKSSRGGVLIAAPPFFTGGQTPPLGAAHLAAALGHAGGRALPLDLELLDLQEAPGHLFLLRDLCSLSWDPSGVSFVSHLPILLHCFGHLSEPTWQAMGLMPLQPPLQHRTDLDRALTHEARELAMLALGLETRARRHALAVQELAQEQGFGTLAVTCAVTSVTQALLLAREVLSDRDGVIDRVILGGPGLWLPQVRNLARCLVPEAIIPEPGVQGFQMLSQASGADQETLVSLLAGPFPWPGCDEPFMGFSLESYGQASRTDEGFMGNGLPSLPAGLGMVCDRRCGFCTEPAVAASMRPPSRGRKLASDLACALALAHTAGGPDFKGSVMACSSYVNLGAPWLEELKQEMERLLPEGMPRWWAYLRPSRDLLEPDITAILRDSGLKWATLGMESGSHSVLERLGKGTDPSCFQAIARHLLDRGVRIMTTFLSGHPNESQEEFDDTLRAVESLLPFRNRGLFFQVSSLLRLEPGSPMFRNPGKWGIRIEPRKLPPELAEGSLAQVLSPLWLGWKDENSWALKLQRRKRLSDLVWGESQGSVT